MKRVLMVTVLAVFLMSIFQTCTDPDPGIGPLYLIEVIPAAVNLEIDSTQQFTAIGRDANMNVIEDLTFTWTSRYPEVGTIDQNGDFSAISSGTTFLTAKSGTIESAQVTVSVYDPVFSIEIQQDSLTVWIDSTAQFTADSKDMNGNAVPGLTFSWATGDTNIATIDNNGIVTGKSEGSTTVTASLRDNESLPAIIKVEYPKVTDIDGNTYETIKIGDQWWLAENLQVTHYRNGDPIPNVTDDSEWANLTTGAYCVYNNNASNESETYGALYNWYAVNDSRNIAPEGWHVPTDEEWKRLEMYLGMSQSDADGTGWRGTDEGGKLKEAGTDHWSSPNTGATNASGFTALPGGSRDAVNPGGYYDMGRTAYFWSATEGDSYSAWYRILSYYYSAVGRSSTNKTYGYSVRLVRD